RPSPNAATGRLSVSPSSAGAPRFTLSFPTRRSSDLAGSQAYTLTVNPASSLTLGPAALPSATVNSTYSTTLSATGGSGAYTFGSSGGRPPERQSRSGAVGRLSRTPTIAGASTFTIAA